MKLAHPSDDSAQALRRFTEWLETRGAKFSNLCLYAYEDGERGAHARAPIRKGDIILELPLRLLLTAEVAWVSAIGCQIEASGLNLQTNHSFLAAYLLQERYAADSFWAPLIATLPVSFPHVPFFFGSEELALLEGSFILAKIDQSRSTLTEDYQELRRCIPGFNRFSLEDFLWAYLAANTRCFGMKIYGRETFGMVPMADMLNHKHPREAAWRYDDSTDRFVLTSLRDFAPGEPVHNSYGRKCNSWFLLHYGFCLEQNEDNRAEIRFEGRIASPGDASLPGRAFHVPASLDHEDTRKMLSFLRLACAGGDDGPHPARGADEEIGPVSLPNETRSLLALAEACRAALSRFPTTLEEDEALLQGQGLTRNARNTILMRQGEKRVLRYFLKLAETAVPWLHRPWSELHAAAAADRFRAGNFDDYLNTVVATLRLPPAG